MKGEEEKEEEENLQADEDLRNGIDPEVIMKTVKITVQNIETGKSEWANALLETGAKRTYITKETAESLGLHHGYGKLFNFNTFGATNSSDMMTVKTRFSIAQKNGSNKMIDAKIVPVITAPTVREKVNLEKYRTSCRKLTTLDLPN